MTGTSSKSPMSGTLTSMLACRRPRRARVLSGAGSACPGRCRTGRSPRPRADGRSTAPSRRARSAPRRATWWRSTSKKRAQAARGSRCGRSRRCRAPRSGRGHEGADLVGERAHVVGRGDHRARARSPRHLARRSEPRGASVGMQPVPALDLQAVAAQLGEAGARSRRRRSTPKSSSSSSAAAITSRRIAPRAQQLDPGRLAALAARPRASRYMPLQDAPPRRPRACAGCS